MLLPHTINGEIPKGINGRERATGNSGDDERIQREICDERVPVSC
jgi:hypothetical protein